MKGCQMKGKKILSFIATVLCMVAIFLFSSQTGSDSARVSSGVHKVLNFISLFKVIPIRKVAHFSLYFLLFLLINSFVNNFIKSNIKCYIISIAVSILYAITDEYHQTFVTGRSGCFKDVCIDTLGVLIALLVYNIFLYFRNKKRKGSDTCVYE